MTFKKIIYISFFFLSLTQIIFAQDSIQSNTPSSEDRIKIIEKAISILPKISGLLNLRYQYSTEAANYSTGKNGFDVRRAYLDFKGNATKDLTYRLQVDFSTSPKIIDAYVEWKPFKFIGLQAGQFKTAYTLENPYSPFALETSDNSQVIAKLIQDYNNCGRDIGLSLNGSFFQKNGYNIIEYKVALLNGNNINTTDNNKTKDVYGILFINPLKSITFDASYYKGQYGIETAKYDRNRSSLGARYDDGKLMVRAEYVAGEIGTTQSNLKNALGYYLTAGYFVTDKIQPVLKYDFYQNDKTSDLTAITNYVIGLNYWLTPKTKLQAIYTHKQNKDSSKTDSDYLVAQLILGF
jgi:phosphate-selective porin